MLYGCLSWESDGVLKLNWEQGCSGTSIEDIIFLIIKNNPLIQNFTYGSLKGKPSNCDMLRAVLIAFKEQVERYSLFIDRKMQSQLRVLCLPNHGEVSSETLVELLGKAKIEELDVSQWELTKDALETLFEHLSGDLNLKKLCVAGNYIDDESFQCLSSLVAGTISLKELDMSSLKNRLMLPTMGKFLDGINEINPTLKKISFGDTEITEADWEAFVIRPLREKLPKCQITACLVPKKLQF